MIERFDSLPTCGGILTHHDLPLLHFRLPGYRYSLHIFFVFHSYNRRL